MDFVQLLLFHILSIALSTLNDIKSDCVRREESWIKTGLKVFKEDFACHIFPIKFKLSLSLFFISSFTIFLASISFQTSLRFVSHSNFSHHASITSPLYKVAQHRKLFTLYHFPRKKKNWKLRVCLCAKSSSSLETTLDLLSRSGAKKNFA